MADPLQEPPAAYTRNKDTGVRFDNIAAYDGVRLLDYYNSFGIPVEDETGFLKGASSAPNFASADISGRILAKCRSGFLHVVSVKVMPLAKVSPPNAPPGLLAPPPFTLLITGDRKS
eukprot:528447_1